MKPVFKIGDNDYTKYVEELKPSSNDLDADGAGRNILDGLMYRSRIATKLKWTVTFLRLPADVLSALLQDMDKDFVRVTMLEPKSQRHVSRDYYCSTINHGVQRHLSGETVYDGVTFNITER